MDMVAYANNLLNIVAQAQGGRMQTVMITKEAYKKALNAVNEIYADIDNDECPTTENALLAITEALGIELDWRE